MKMHWGKTKVMIESRTEECELSIESEDIEDVKNLKYLGAIISVDGLCDEEVEH